MTEEKNNQPGNWYLAKIVFQIIVGESSDTQFDEQYRLICALSMELAFEKAKKIGLHVEGTFLNVEMERVCWKFIDVSAIHPINFSNDGEQVYSETFETEDSSSYIHTIHQRAKACLETETSFHSKKLFC